MNTIKFFKKIINHLEEKKKKDLILVIILSFLSSLAEFISLAILIPFVGFFFEPNTYLFTKSIQEIFLFFNINSKEEILTFVSISFIVIVLLSAFIKIFYIKRSNKLTEDITSDFRIKIFN